MTQRITFSMVSESAPCCFSQSFSSLSASGSAVMRKIEGGVSTEATPLSETRTDSRSVHEVYIKTIIIAVAEVAQVVHLFSLKAPRFVFIKCRFLLLPLVLSHNIFPHTRVKADMCWHSNTWSWSLYHSTNVQCCFLFLLNHIRTC